MMTVVKNIFKIILKIISDICFVLAFLYGFLYLPKIFGYTPVGISKDLVSSQFKEGSLVYYNKPSSDEIKIGDFIVCSVGKREYVIYEVDHITDDGLFETTDSGKLKYDNIAGKIYPVKVPYAGYYLLFIQERIGLFYLMVIIIAVDIIFSSLFDEIRRLLKSYIK